MMLDDIPKIPEDLIKEQFEMLQSHITQGHVKDWLNGELQTLHETNPVLFHYLIERAQKFAMGAVMVGDPNSISVSLALEYILLLNILNSGIHRTIGLTDFKDMLTRWVGKDGLNGLNDLGEDKSK